jgi:hypothetical protein
MSSLRGGWHLESEKDSGFSTSVLVDTRGFRRQSSVG